MVMTHPLDYRGRNKWFIWGNKNIFVRGVTTKQMYPVYFGEASSTFQNPLLIWVCVARGYVHSRVDPFLLVPQDFRKNLHNQLRPGISSGISKTSSPNWIAELNEHSHFHVCEWKQNYHLPTGDQRNGSGPGSSALVTLQDPDGMSR